METFPSAKHLCSWGGLTPLFQLLPLFTYFTIIFQISQFIFIITQIPTYISAIQLENSIPITNYVINSAKYLCSWTELIHLFQPFPLFPYSTTIFQISQFIFKILKILT